ncbi:hypothetical protein HKCCE3408_14195 [Rhodobacterales bacterium HKCCE3408]|nr:hypothetical protein [Rhodobacterales bacterium HKCCE3408]
MSENATQLAALSRPRLLVQAARNAAAATMRRRMAAGRPAGGAIRFDRLMEREAALDTARRGGAAGYSPTAHVRVLTELLAAAGDST